MASEKPQIIDYFVKDHKSYGTQSDIRKINQKSDKFMFVAPQSQFSVTLKLKSPALLINVEMKVEQVDHYSLFFKYKGENTKSIYHIVKPDRKQKNKGKIDTHNFQEPTLVDQVALKIINAPSQRQSIIFYIIIKGFKDEQKSSGKGKITNLSEKQQIQYKPKVHKEIKAQVFNQRSKRKVTSPQQLQKEVMLSGKKNIVIQESDQQLRKAIELSKKEQRSQKKQQFQEPQQNQSEDQNINYRVREIDEKDGHVYKHVNMRWVHAQLKMEEKRCVRPKHSVSNYFIKDLFKGQGFYLASKIFGNRREIQSEIQLMGGRIQEKIFENSWIICQNLDDKTIKEGLKLFRGVKAVNLHYIYDCHSKAQKLNSSDYKVLK